MAKEAGTAHFKAGEYREALACYSTALDDAAGDDVASGSLQSNISACHAALGGARGGGARGRAAAGLAEGALARGRGAPRARRPRGGGGGDRAAAAAGGDAASKDVALIEGLLRNQQLEALIERGAFNKRDDDDTGGGASAAAARPQKREKTAEEVAYARSVKAWMDAAKAGDVDGLAQCLAAEPWLLSNRSENTSEKQLGNSALHWAAARGKPAALQWLLGRDGVDVNLRNEAGGTALHSAAAHARSKEVALLLDAGADASIKDETNEIARDAASRRGYKIVEAAIDRGPTAPARRATLAAAAPPTADEAKAAGARRSPRRAPTARKGRVALHGRADPRPRRRGRAPLESVGGARPPRAVRRRARRRRRRARAPPRLGEGAHAAPPRTRRRATGRAPSRRTRRGCRTTRRAPPSRAAWPRRGSGFLARPTSLHRLRR